MLRQLSYPGMYHRNICEFLLLLFFSKHTCLPVPFSYMSFTKLYFDSDMHANESHKDDLAFSSRNDQLRMRCSIWFRATFNLGLEDSVGAH